MGRRLELECSRPSLTGRLFGHDDLVTAVAALTTCAAAILITLLSDANIRGFHLNVAHGAHVTHLAFTAMAFALLACVCAHFFTQFVLVKSPVRNLADPAALRSRNFPNFVYQDPNSKLMLQFRNNLNQILAEEYSDSLTKAVAIRQWVRRQQTQERRMWTTPFLRNHENPSRLLREQSDGVPGACRRFSYILLGALLSAGFDARIVGFTSSVLSRGVSSHAAVEVWIEELNQWVLLDPTLDTLVLIRGKLASGLDLLEAVADEQLDEMTFERNGAGLVPHPSPATYAMYCRHLFVATSNAIFDGYAVRLFGPRRIRFMHYSPTAPYPVFRKRLALCVGSYGMCLSTVFFFLALHLMIFPE